MTADEFRAQLESELLWRQEEIAFFKNCLNDIEDENKDRYRKSLVLILYSHFEGFVKISFQIYIEYINSCNLKRKDVVTELQASSLERELNAYDNLDRKSEVFRRTLPDDKEVHRLFRRIDLISSFSDFIELPLTISDTIIDTESNLWYHVLQKNMYKIGLPLDLFEDCKDDINGLVNRRNSIAHGNSRAGVTTKEYNNWEAKTNRVISTITRKLFDYASNNKFLSQNLSG